MRWLCCCCQALRMSCRSGYSTPSRSKAISKSIVSVRRSPSGQRCEERRLWLCGHDWIVSTWSGDGDFQASSDRDRNEGEFYRKQTETAAADGGGEAADCRRD